MAEKKPHTHFDIYIPSYSLSFDVPAFDDLLRQHGVVLVHYRALLCPLGVFDRDDSRSHADHDNCSGGFLYKSAGEVTVFFSGNQTSSVLENVGIIDGSTVQVTVPRFYDGEDQREVSIQHHDRFFLKDVQAFSISGEYFEASQTGVDRTHYQILQVEELMDAHGKEYRQGEHFIISNGNIKWLDTRPGFDPELNRGTICSIRYRYRPFWYIKTLIHEVRVSRDINPETGEIGLVRMPMACIIQREWVFEGEKRSTMGKADARDNPGPRSGGFGPR